MSSGCKIYCKNPDTIWGIFVVDDYYNFFEIQNDSMTYVSEAMEHAGSGNFRNCRITIDPSDKLHVFLRTDDYYWNKLRQLHFVSEDQGRTFSNPVFVSELSFEFRLVGKPIILSDGSIILGHSRYLWSAPNSFLDGFVQIDRGYGFGNSDYMQVWGLQDFYHESLTYPTIQVTDDYHLFTATVFSGWENGDLKTRVELLDYPPNQYAKPYIQITTPFTLYDNLLFGEDQLRVCLDIYNPLDTQSEVEMAIGTELSCIPGYFFFISDQTGFPTYELEYASFHTTLPPSTFYQNVPIISFPLIDLVPLSESYGWDWYAVLLDSKTGELLDYSHDRCGYSHWDDIPDY